jgi:hypothetical protein
VFSKTPVEDLRAILAAYRLVKNSSWPQLHPAMDRRFPYWHSASEAELSAELEGYLAETTAEGCGVRVFWKLGPKLLFAGCNEHFASDAGVPAAELMGMDDFDDRLPWKPQASKYRADDLEVVQSGAAKLDILERQKSPSGGVIWTRVGKAPIMASVDRAIGILGLYETVDGKTASKLFMARQASKP